MKSFARKHPSFNTQRPPRRPKRLAYTVLAAVLSAGFALQAQSLPGYYERSRFLMAPPAAFEEGLVGFVNPANLRFLHRPELRFIWSTDGRDALSLQDWGVFAGFRPLGFSFQRQHPGGVGVTDFRISTAWGTRALALGLAYGWSSGKNDASGRAKLLALGSVWRPAPHLSLALLGNFSLESRDREGVAEIGVRPFGGPRLTLFADAALRNGVRVQDAPWSVGAVWQPVDGLHLVGRYFKSTALTLGLVFNFGRGGLGAQSRFDAQGSYASNDYVVRVGGLKPSVVQTGLLRRKFYVPLALKGRVDYLKFAFLDGTRRFLDVLQDIEAAVADPRVAALAVNLSAMRVRPEHAWEIREALRRARLAGKRVVTFVDQGGMNTYHLASVADRVVMDPQGSLRLQGYVLGRTYLKGTLEKLGLGFDEWRFFKYKSAYETYSRDQMSEADREQRQAYVDDWYEQTRADVCSARGLAPEEFDRIIDEETYLTARNARKLGLVDTLARWSDVGEIVRQVVGSPQESLPADALLARALPPRKWGTSPRIAVVYGLGVCAMDEGIKARWLERVFRSLAGDPSVKAVVFRVDSPGGDGMASDVVAEAIKKCRKSKPVIVSQGQVAGSGGYWISMYGDTIVAGPTTVTGSIGVIGGWVYDKGFGGKLGLTADHVQRGKRADLGRGVRLPFLNLEVPARNLTEEERAQIESLFHELYDEFVQKVAAGRDLSEAHVRQIAEGRIYSGTRGRELGLVDEIGGLLHALALAKQRVGLTPEDEVEIVEFPKSKGLVDLREQLSPVGVAEYEDPVLSFLRLVSAAAGRPLYLVPPGWYPWFAP